MFIQIFEESADNILENTSIPLNVMSDYSIGESNLSIDSIIRTAKSLKMPALALTDRTLAGAVEFYLKCKVNGIKPIICQKIRFKNSDVILFCKDFEAYKILCKHSVEFATQTELELNLLLTEEEIKHFICITEQNFSSQTELLETVQKIVNQIPYIFPEDYFESKNAYKRMMENLPDFENAEKVLSDFVKEGLRKRGLENNQEAVARSEYELKDIIEHNWTKLYLFQQELTSWCRKNNICYGPGRGASGSSIVSYLLEITDINPLEYNLFYERFANPCRVTYPDFDIEFDYERTEDIISHIQEKYGKEHVSRIATYKRITAKTALKTAGMELGFAEEEINKIVCLIPDTSARLIGLKKLINGTCFRKKGEDTPYFFISYSDGKKIKSFFRNKKYENLIKTAQKLEGIIEERNFHSSGYLITKEPVYNYVPCSIDKKTGSLICEYTFDVAEICGLYKNDILRLVELSKLSKIQTLIQKKDKNFNYREISLEDKKTLKSFCKADTKNVFQFESSGVKSILKQLKPDSFSDLMMLNTMYRPGLMNYIPAFIDAKSQPETVRYPDVCLEEILKETYGMMIYQEQIMQTAVKIAGLSLGAADMLRRAMGRKNSEVLLIKKKEFVEDSLKQGFSEQQAESIFNIMIPFAEFAFNKSHAVAYTKMAFWDMYLKTHYREEYDEVLKSIPDTSADYR